MNNEVIKLYRYGYDIEEIVNSTGGSEGEIYHILFDFKKKNSTYNGRRLNDDFKKLVCDRISAGASRNSVAEELNISWSLIYDSLKRFGGEELQRSSTRGRKSEQSNGYTLINWRSFDQCPECLGFNVNDVNSYLEEEIEVAKRIKNSYCIDCGTEWLEKENNVVKVDWEFLEH